MLDGKIPKNIATTIVSLIAGDTEMSLRITGSKQDSGQQAPR